MKLFPCRLPILALTVISILTGCREVRILSPEQAELDVKLQQLRAEDKELQEKLTTLRQAVPANINSTQAATNLALKNQGDNQLISQQLAKAVQSYEDTEAALRVLEKEMEALRKRSQP